MLLSEGGTYALLYLSLLKKLQRVDTMQYLLVLIADALAGKQCSLQRDSWCRLTRGTRRSRGEDSSVHSHQPSRPRSPLRPPPKVSRAPHHPSTRANKGNRALDTSDEFVQLKAAQILTILLRSVDSPSPFAVC